MTSDGDDQSPSRSSRYSRKNSVSDRDHEETPGPSGTQESPWAIADGEKRLPPSLQRHPSRSVQSSENVNSPRKKSSNPPIRSGPPSIPLPRTPVPGASSSDVLLSPLRQTSNTELEATSIQKLIACTQAHTIGSVGDFPLLDDRPASNTTATLTPPSESMDIPGKDLDIDTASELQLRAALRSWNQQPEYDEIDTYVVKITEAHAMEVTNLGKKIHTLKREVAIKDKELQDLRWIINNLNGNSSPPQPRIPNHSFLSPPLSEPEDNSRIIPGTSSRLYYQSESGAESHVESIQSAASGSNSVSYHHKSLRTKPSTLAELTYNVSHTGSTFVDRQNSHLD